jgi:phosphoglycolate phosphatase-like HAD superfamily hydrolase
LAVVTSSVKSPLETYFADNRIADCFSAIYDMDTNRSKVEKFRHVFATHGTRPEQCVFVTDTLGDVWEATTARVPTIAVTWGFHPRETLARGNPAAIIGTPSELVPAVDRHFLTSPL